MTGPAPTTAQDATASSAWTPGRRAVSVLFVFLLAVVVRLVAHDQMAAAADTFAPVGDGEIYTLQALRVAAGEDITDGVTFQPPLYPWLLGLALRAVDLSGTTTPQTVDEVPAGLLAATLRVGRALNFGLGVLAVLLVTALARRAFGDRAALFTGILAALYGPFLFYEGLIMKETLSLLVLPLAALAATAALRAQTRRDEGTALWFACGLVLGAGGLMRGNLLALGWIGALMVLLRGGPHHRIGDGLRDAFGFAAGLIIAIAPVAMRNSVVAGRPVLATAAPGTSFYACNPPGGDTGLAPNLVNDRGQPRRVELDWMAEAQVRSHRALSPGEVSEYWLQAALVGISDHPGKWLLAEVRKVFLMASRYEAPDDVLPSFAEAEVPLLRWTPARFSVIFPLALGGLWLAWRRRLRGMMADAPSILALGLLLYALTLLIFAVSSRFRLPAVPLLLVPAGYFLSELRSVLADGWRGEGGRAALVVGAGLLLASVSESPLGPLSGRQLVLDEVIALRNRAAVAAGRGDLDAARGDLDRAVDIAGLAGLEQAALYASQARLDRVEARSLATGSAAGDAAADLQARAERELKRGAAVEPDDPMVLREQGLLLFDTGRDEEAVGVLLRAHEASPRDRDVLQHLALAQLHLGDGAQAQDAARALVNLEPRSDDGWGLLALALLQDGRIAEAREAVLRYDAEALMREAHGLSRRLPESPDFAALRTGP